nr:GntR family transcriptional regulator [Agrobacterium fabrum]
MSRPSLREALIALEIDNTVEIRMGSGVYVSTEALQTTHHTKSLGDSPSELMQARAALEGATIVAGSKPDDRCETIAALRQNSQHHAKGNRGWPQTLDQDRLFHVTMRAIRQQRSGEAGGQPLR